MFFRFLTSSSYFLVLFLLFFLPFHAFLVTWVGTFFGSTADSVPLGMKVVSVWKEMILFVLTVFAALRWWKDPHFSFVVTKFDVFILLLGLLALLLQLWHPVPLDQWIFGMLTDFRFFLFFFLVRTLEWDTKWIQRLFWVLGISIGLVLLWGVFLKYAPSDFLLQFGYSPYISSYMPNKPLPIFHTIAETGEMRLASTFAGPNQFGAFLLIPFGFLLAFLRKKQQEWWRIAAFVCLAFVGIELFWSFSRSAWLGAFLMVFFFILSFVSSSRARWGILFGGVVFSLVMSAFVWAVSPEFVEKNVFRHTSTSEHLLLMKEGGKFVLEHPLGIGVSQAGPVSMRFAEWPDRGFISENWYLQIFEELGWVGGIFFLLLFLGILFYFWKDKTNTFSFSVFLFLLGIGGSAFFLHSWADASVALMAWGVAGVAMGKVGKEK